MAFGSMLDGLATRNTAGSGRGAWETRRCEPLGAALLAGCPGFQTTADSYPSKPIFNLDFPLSKPPASLDATALGCATRFNPSPANMPGLMHDRRFQCLPVAGQSLSSGCTADPSEEAEMSDSAADDGLPSARKIIARSKSTIDLTLDDDDDDSADDKNAIEEASSELPETARHSVTLIPPL
jgi:hypothetical protein